MNIERRAMTLRTADEFILVSANGAALFKRQAASFYNEVTTIPWSAASISEVINRVVDHTTKDLEFDIIICSSLTEFTSIAMVSRESGVIVQTEGNIASISVQDELENKKHILRIEESVITEVCKEFSGFFPRAQKIILRAPNTDFRYMLYVDTADLSENGMDWQSALRSGLTVVLPRIGQATSFRVLPAPMPKVKPAEPDLEIPPEIAESKATPTEPVLPENGPAAPQISRSDKVVTVQSPAKDYTSTTARPEQAAPSSVPETDNCARPHTFIFPVSNDLQLSFLAAGYISALGQSVESVIEVGAYRKKLRSDFNRLSDVGAVFEMNVLPPSRRDCDALTQALLDHLSGRAGSVVFFGAEVLRGDAMAAIHDAIRVLPFNIDVVIVGNPEDAPHVGSNILSTFESWGGKRLRVSCEDVQDASCVMADLTSGWSSFALPRVDATLMRRLLSEDQPFALRNVDTFQQLKTNGTFVFAKWLSALKTLMKQVEN